MIKYIIEAGALIGGGFGLIAYWPQIKHLLRVKNAAGISLSAWYLWLLGNIFPLIYAIYISDRVFIILQALYVGLCAWMIVLVYKYKNRK